MSQKQPQVIYYRSSEGEDSMAGMQQTGAGGERNERAVQSRSPSEAEVITAGGTQTVFIYVSFEFSSSVLQWAEAITFQFSQSDAPVQEAWE